MGSGSDVASFVQGVVAEQLRIPLARVRLPASLGALGADDAAALRICLNIERELHVVIAEELCNRSTTLAALVEHVAHSGPTFPAKRPELAPRPTVSAAPERATPRAALAPGEVSAATYAAIVASAHECIRAAATSIGEVIDIAIGASIPSNKRLEAADAHGCDPASVFFLRDLTFWGSARKSILIGAHGVSFKVSDERHALTYPWRDIEIARFDDNHLRLFTI